MYCITVTCLCTCIGRKGAMSEILLYPKGLLAFGKDRPNIKGRVVLRLSDGILL